MGPCLDTAQKGLVMAFTWGVHVICLRPRSLLSYVLEAEDAGVCSLMCRGSKVHDRVFVTYA